MNITEEHAEWATNHPNRIILGRLLGKYLVDAGVIPSNTVRCIIDIPVDGPVTLYIQKFGSANLLHVDWIKALADHGEVIEYVDAPAAADAPRD